MKRSRHDKRAMWRHCPTCGCYLHRDGGGFQCPDGHAVKLSKIELKRFWHRRLTQFEELASSGEIRRKQIIEE